MKSLILFVRRFAFGCACGRLMVYVQTSHLLAPAMRSRSHSPVRSSLFVDEGNQTNGPEALLAQQRWAADLFGRASDVDADVRARLQGKLNRGILLTSHFSGVGTPEAAAGYIQSLAKSLALETRRRICTFSVCEQNAECREALLEIPSDADGPCHVFGDILSYAPSCDLESLITPDRSVACLSDELQTLRSAREASAKKVQHVDRNMRRWCYRHAQECPCYPSAEALKDGWLHIDISGTPCIAFSPMGKQEKLHHPSTLCLLVWTALMDRIRPDLIIHEN